MQLISRAANITMTITKLEKSKDNTRQRTQTTKTDLNQDETGAVKKWASPALHVKPVVNPSSEIWWIGMTKSLGKIFIMSETVNDIALNISEPDQDDTHITYLGKRQV